MPQHESASSVYSGVLHDTPAGAIAVWVTRNGVRRIGGVTSKMIEEGHWDADGHPTLSAALHQLGEYFNLKPPPVRGTDRAGKIRRQRSIGG